MSNEYKDYMLDRAQDCLLDTGYLRRTEYCTEWGSGYLVVGYSPEWSKKVYFVWLDDVEGWSFREVFP